MEATTSSSQEVGEDKILENPKGCFFIYDSHHEEETADPEEFILFFYPEFAGKKIAVETKSFLLGACSALINFARSFTTNPLQVVTLKKTKIAFKQVPKDITLVLCSCTVEEETLIAQLESLYTAFCFYNGSFDDVFEQYKRLTRKELLVKFQHIGSFLTPLLRKSGKGLLAAFDPIPYTELPTDKDYNREFLLASQILNKIRVDSPNLAGCLFYSNGKNKSVLCTHLDTDTTRWVRNLVAIMIRKNAKRKRATNRDHPIEHVDETDRSFYHPFLSKETLASLQKDTTQPPIEWPKDRQTQKRLQLPELPEFMTRDNPRGRFVGLYILCLKHISLAVLMELPALYDIRHINKIKSSFDDLDALEESLEKYFKDKPQLSQMHAMNVKKQKGAVVADASRQTYNWLTYEGMSCIAAGSPLNMPVLKETERSFLHAAEKVHHSFKADQRLSQVVLRDCNGCVYCHRTFGREVYHHRLHNLRAHADFMHGLEKEVSKKIKEDANLTLL